MLVVEDNCTEIGTIEQGKYRKLETFKQDSCRVIFTLGEKRDGWLGTDIIKLQDTIKIDDNTKIFELIVE